MLASFRQTYRLALVQKMGAQGDDRLAGLQRAGHPRGFIIQAEHGHRLPGDGGRTRGNAPDARAVTRIVDRRQGTASTWPGAWSLPMRRVTVDPSGAFASAPLST